MSESKRLGPLSRYLNMRLPWALRRFWWIGFRGRVLSRFTGICWSVIPLSSVAALLPTSLPLRLERAEQQGLWLTLTVVSTQEARACPVCGQASTHVHSRYQRTLADLPVQGLRLRFCLGVRRFYCRVRDCGRQVFCERLNGLARSYARQTQRLAACFELMAQALGGHAGARLAERLSLPTSATMLLRRLRRFVTPPSASPRVVGIDDWAYKRGQTYGTILVDLEQHRVLDLLPDRTTETVTAWLRKHPGIEVISRDRAGVYADAARQGAPQAAQVADRWHLRQNLTEAVQRVVERYYPHLREVVQTSAVSVHRNLFRKLRWLRRWLLPNNDGKPEKQRDKLVVPKSCVCMPRASRS